MRIKITLFVLLAVGVGAVASLWSGNDEVIAEYSTRESQIGMSSAEGVAMINKLLKANIETGEIEPEDQARMAKAVREHQKKTASAKSIGLEWKELGPDNIGGRTRAMVIVDENTIFAGSVSGGLYRTDNGGNSWYKVVSPDFCVIGSMAMTGNGDLYVGTGAQFESGGSGTGSSGFTGNGLWKSTDMGDTWEVIDGTEPAFLSTSGSWNSINTLEADPLQDDKVWIGGDAGVGYYEGNTDNLVMNQDAAEGLTTAAGQDIEISADGSVYLVVQGAGKVYVSLDGAQTFEAKNGGTDGLPNGMGRARVAVSDQDPNYCYVLFSTSSGAMGGAWYSDDSGQTWTPKWPGGVSTLDPMGSNTQGIYDLALGVDPENPQRAYVGGVTLWHYGVTITPAQIAFGGGFGGGGSLEVHPDIHEFENGPNGRTYIATDGGIYITEDNGDSFFSANRGYNTVQFYGIGISSGEPVAGGAQDNGTMVMFRDGSGNTLEEAIQIGNFGDGIGGKDGFYTELSQATGGIGMVIGTAQRGIFERFDENGGGGTFYDLNMDNQALNGEGEAGGFFTTIALYEDTEDEMSQQYTLVANPTSADITDTTLIVFTNNLNIPFEYVLEDGDVLHFWEEIERPALVTTEPLTEDPNYWWLDIQILDSVVEVCALDSEFVETINMQVDSTAIELCDTIYSEVLEMDIIDCIITGYEPIFEDVDFYDYFETCYDEYYYGADVVSNVREQRKIIDPYTSMFVIGFTGDDGIWLTRQALNFGVVPHWYRIVDNAPGGPNGTKRFEFAQNGNDLWYCGWGATLHRVSNLENLWQAALESDGDESYIGGDVDSLEYYIPNANAGGTITGIASDPNNPNHMVITIGGYGIVGDGKVQETWNALDPTPDWENIWFGSSNELARMPIYDALIDVTDPTGQSIVVGTEFGVFTTDSGGGNDWVQENGAAAGEWSTGIDNCPTYEIRQQKILEPMQFREPTNSGVIYAGTHGRGMFSSVGNYVGINDWDNADNGSSKNDLLLIYPNPVTTNATVEFDLRNRQDVILRVYSIQGELIEVINRNNLGAGTQRIELDLNRYTNGNYMIQLEAGSASKIGRFVKL